MALSGYCFNGVVKLFVNNYKDLNQRVEQFGSILDLIFTYPLKSVTYQIDIFFGCDISILMKNITKTHANFLSVQQVMRKSSDIF